MSDAIRTIAQFTSDKLLFGWFYFPHYFRMDSPSFHRDIIVTCKDNKWVAIHAPRGSAKSTVGTFLDSVHGICLKQERFIIIIQNTYAKAVATLNNIKYEFKYNEQLKADFKVDMNTKDAEGDTIFTHPLMPGESQAYAVRVLCKGADQLGTIRGERFGAYRPTLIIADDLEDDEMVRNSERRITLDASFNEVLNYAGDKTTRVIVIGTVLHDDSLLANLLREDRYGRFKKIFYDVEVAPGISLWPEKWTWDELKRMEADDPVGYAKEMRGDPSSGSMETIRREDFRYWAIINDEAVLYDEQGATIHRWRIKDCQAAITCDLAWEDKKASDFSAIVPGIVTPGNDILIDTYIARRGLRPDELEEILFDMSARYELLTGRRVKIGFEKAKLEKVMKWFLSEAQRRNNKWLWLVDVNWGTKDKIERVLARLGNRYAQHSVYHRRGMGELENQLIRLRSVAHDDIADAAAMLPEILNFASQKEPKERKRDTFMWLRTQTPAYKDKQRRETPYQYGRTERPNGIKTSVAMPI